MSYKGVLSRYLITDLVAVFFWFIVALIIAIFIKRLLPADDFSNKAIRRILHVVLIIGSALVLFGALTEIHNIILDMQDELYISATGSFTTDRDRMYFTNEHGERLLLKIRPIMPDYENSKQATVIYSENSKILLDVISNQL